MKYVDILQKKKNLPPSDYELCESSFTCTDCTKSEGVLIESKHNFHHHVDHIFLDSYVVGVNSNSNFLLFLSTGPSDLILHIRQF
jgi:hypothetical protein